MSTTLPPRSVTRTPSTIPGGSPPALALDTNGGDRRHDVARHVAELSLEHAEVVASLGARYGGGSPRATACAKATSR